MTATPFEPSPLATASSASPRPSPRGTLRDDASDPHVQLAALARLLGRARALRLVAIALAWALLPVLVLALSHIVLGVPSRTGVAIVAIVTGAIGIVTPIRRGARQRVTATDAALWVERAEPRLRYALVTLADASPAERARLEPFVRAVPWHAPAATIARARLRQSLTMLGAAVAGFALALWPWRERSDAGAAIMRGAPVPPSAIATLPPGAVAITARLVPPAYTRAPDRPVALDGGVVEAIEGTRLEIEGAAGAARVVLRVREAGDTAGARAVTLERSDEAWRAVVRVGAQPVAVLLADGITERSLTIAARPDSVPEASLDLPATDVVTRDTTATIALRGRAHDDIGIADARLEWILTTGGGEQFAARTGVLGARTGALDRDVAVQGTLDLGALGVKPGDVLHVRLAARDGNAVRGAQLGTSDTRVIRIPRSDEGDSVAVEQLPPSPVDTSVISQRMLLLLTERLVARQRTLARDAVVAESRRIGAQQGRLRRQVGAVIFMRTGDTPGGEHAHFAGDGHDHTASELAQLQQPRTPEAVLKAAERATAINATLDDHGDETPVVAVNRPLLEAYNAMWDASRALDGAEPASAIAPMRRAVAAIQRARAAERLYLRGAPPAVLVDIAKIRLTGTDSARADARTPLPARPDAGAALATRLDRALVLLARVPRAGTDSLRLLRLDALAARPVLARALDDALGALATGADATTALQRARRAAALVPVRGDATPLWSTGAP